MKNVARILSLVLVAVLLCGVLASCMGGPNKDYKKAEEALDEAGYYTTVYAGKKTELVDFGADGLEAYISAANTDKEFVIIIYFESAEDAKEYWNDEIKEDKKEMIENYAEEGYTVKVARSGSVIYMGTKEAIKAAR